MARVTANPQKNPAPSRPALKPAFPATAYATKVSPRKTRINVPSTSPRYFLVQPSDTAIDSSSLTNATAVDDGSLPGFHSHFHLPRSAHKQKALTCTLQLERRGQDFSFLCPAGRCPPVIAQRWKPVNTRPESTGSGGPPLSPDPPIGRRRLGCPVR